MSNKPEGYDLARRERQIMDAIHRLGEASVGEVLEQLDDPPSYSSVRTMIRYLESKGLLKHRQDGKRYVYSATQSRASASRTALRKLVDVFFSGSASDTVAALLDLNSNKLSSDELDRITRLIQKARSEGK
jgi:predicted transcriptional regulator